MTASRGAAATHPWLRRLGWPLLACALLAGAAWAIWRPRKDAAPRFETTAADRGRITARVTATGTLSALVTVQVGSQVSGRIQELNADFNSTVKKGQVIAKIDPELFRASLEQARANLIAAKGNVARAQAQAEDLERQAKRSEQLADRKLIAPADRDTAVSNAAAARAQVQAAQGSEAQAIAALTQAQVNIAYTDIMSPIDGVVISRSVDVGQTVAASLQAPTLFTIAEDLRRMQVDTSVAESDVGKLSPGMSATFTVDAYPSQRFEGKVRQIRNAPQTVQNVVTYDAVIDVENPELKLKPGMTANVTFVYMDRADVVRIPNAALRFRPAPELLAKSSDSDAAGSGAAGSGAAGSGAAGSGAAGSSAAGSGAISSGAAGSGGPGGRRAAGDGAAGGGGGAWRRGPGGQAGPDGQRGGGASDRRTVWVLKDGQPTSVRIRTGVTDGSFTEVAENSIQPGDQVITAAVSDTASSARPGAAPPGPAGGLRRIF